MNEVEYARKKRSPNWIASEKHILISLIEKYHSDIENNRTDSMNMRQKCTAWEKLAAEFNALTPHSYRSVSNLKLAWENMKKAAKKESANARMELFKTEKTESTENDPTMLPPYTPSCTEEQGKMFGDWWEIFAVDVDDYFSDYDQDPTYEPNDKELNLSSESDSFSDTESDDHNVIVPVSAPAPVPVPSSHHQVPVVLPQEPNWSKSESVPPIPNFQGEGGVSQHIRDIDNATPYLLFRKLFTDELVSHIAFHTNLYATQKEKPFTNISP
ncbi:hypothetical protein C0J52_13912 [Blattella germanica]|nr:hypothetical protein C0J52_13912 [Blattella germanica]